MTTESAIESILFFRGEPMSKEALARYLSLDEKEIEDSLSKLEKSLEDRGIVLVTEGKNVALGTHKDASEIIENIVKESLKRDIGKAGLEVLSIVTYKGSVSKKEIEYIRGVNSSYIIRNLMIRGLIEIDESNTKSSRSRYFKPTLDLMAHLGISSISELPEYETIKKETDDIIESEHENENQSDE